MVHIQSLIFDQTSTKTLSQSNKLLPIIYGKKNLNDAHGL